MEKLLAKYLGQCRFLLGGKAMLKNEELMDFLGSKLTFDPRLD
jgi:hypothetical protein